MTSPVWRKSSFSAADENCVEISWRKSSFSAGDENCVEIAWRKSSFSGGNDEVCVELAHLPGKLAVRDSKNPDGPMLVVDQFSMVRATNIMHTPKPV